MNGNNSFLGKSGFIGTYSAPPYGGSYSNNIETQYNSGTIGNGGISGFGVFYVAPGSNLKMNSNDASIFYVKWVNAT